MSAVEAEVESHAARLAACQQEVQQHEAESQAEQQAADQVMSFSVATHSVGEEGKSPTDYHDAHH